MRHGATIVHVYLIYMHYTAQINIQLNTSLILVRYSCAQLISNTAFVR